MVNDLNYWIEKASKYAKEHPSVIHVSKIIKENDKQAFEATFQINLPGKYDLCKITANGIKKHEAVKFVFPNNFPFQAPEIILRDDFPRDFPHINPSMTKVIPCIFDGSLDELLQQPKWFDHILDQITEWLEKASSNSLMDLKQGWESFRIDNANGLILFQKEPLIKEISSKSGVQFSIVRYFKIKKIILCMLIGTEIKYLEEENSSKLLFFSTKEGHNVSKYLTYPINTFSDLVKFAKDCFIEDFPETINEEINVLSKEILFVSFLIRRPVKLIHESTNYEFFNCAIVVKKNKKNQKIHQKSEVLILQHNDVSNSDLLRRFSGVKEDSKTIIGIGCGSLGSKIILHLARNGNCRFILFDKSMFSPHNNARHALVNDSILSEKAKLLSDNCQKMGIDARYKCSDIKQEDLSGIDADLIIDSSANLSVRNYLCKAKDIPPIINASLYDNGKTPILLVEGKEKSPDINNLMSIVYSECLRNNDLQQSVFSNKAVLTSIGQGCGSYTTICQDAIISLSAASISLKIQKILSVGIQNDGFAIIGKIEDEEVKWTKITCPPLVKLKNIRSEIQVYLLPHVKNKMDFLSEKYSPKETGGVLIGHISYIDNSIIITDLIDAPEDSIMTPNYFELGVKGLKRNVNYIERKTNCMLTYVGTWHSHPFGGAPSHTDRITKTKLIVLRDYEPTVCLIWTPTGIINI